MRKLLSLVLFLACRPCLSVEVVILVNPKTPLDKDAVLEPIFHVFGVKAAVVKGDKVAKAGFKEGGYVIEMLAPTAIPETVTENLKFEVEEQPKPVTYKKVHLVQGYKVWHLKDAAATPVLLGEGFALALESQIQAFDGTRRQLTKKTVEELTLEAMRQPPGIVAINLHHALSGKIMLGTPERFTTAIFAKSFRASFSMPFHHQFNLQQRLDRPFFMSTKPVDAAGVTLLEFQLHNRLPLAASGQLQAYRNLDQPNPGAIGIAPPPGVKTPSFLEGPPVDFSLKANEKATVVLRLPPRTGRYLTDCHVGMTKLALGVTGLPQ